MEKTWSQRVIAKLTRVLGEPRWRRLDKEPPPFAIAQWEKLIGWERWVAIGVVLDEPEDEYSHAGIEVGVDGLIVKVYTSIDDAPEADNE